jgi:hypothetical protein
MRASGDEIWQENVAAEQSWVRNTGMGYQAAYRLSETTDRAKIEAPAASPVMNKPKATSE